MAASLGEWHWSGKSERLKIDLSSEEFVSALSGEWGLSEFGVLLNGLSRRQVVRTFEAKEGIVSCPLTLGDGRTLHMVGAFNEDADAHGLLLSETVVQSAVTAPGPALVPVFQPIISLKSGKVAGFEALARWSNPQSKADAPEQLDDKALASNMMIHACQALDTWRNIAGYEDLFIQVNLTGRDLTDPKLIELVSALIDGYNLAPGILRLELTEQAALRDLDQAISVAKALRELGAALILDDFGTGHSSFLWLARLPADSLKVDFDLISQISDQRVRTILETITLLAKRLDMTITAEGVEQRDLLHVLQDIGFDYAQGFALGRPMTVPAATALLTEAA